jgi:hypothetical protein
VIAGIGQVEPHGFFEVHSGAVTILILCALILGALLILVPQLLRSHQRSMEIHHQERMRSLEKGLEVPWHDPRVIAAGRITLLVPMVVICAAATVTCFLVAYNSDTLFSVSLAAWCVSGVVALAAVTGGIALMGRLAALEPEEPESNEAPVSDRKDQG